MTQSNITFKWNELYGTPPLTSASKALKLSLSGSVPYPNPITSVSSAASSAGNGISATASMASNGAIYISFTFPSDPLMPSGAVSFELIYDFGTPCNSSLNYSMAADDNQAEYIDEFGVTLPSPTATVTIDDCAAPTLFDGVTLAVERVGDDSSTAALALSWIATTPDPVVLAPSGVGTDNGTTDGNSTAMFVVMLDDPSQFIIGVDADLIPLPGGAFASVTLRDDGALLITLTGSPGEGVIPSSAALVLELELAAGLPCDSTVSPFVMSAAAATVQLQAASGSQVSLQTKLALGALCPPSLSGITTMYTKQGTEPAAVTIAWSDFSNPNQLPISQLFLVEPTVADAAIFTGVSAVRLYDGVDLSSIVATAEVDSETRAITVSITNSTSMPTVGAIVIETLLVDSCGFDNTYVVSAALGSSAVALSPADSSFSLTVPACPAVLVGAGLVSTVQTAHSFTSVSLLVQWTNYTNTN